MQNNEKQISHLSNWDKACQFFLSAGVVAFLWGERVPPKWLSDEILWQPLKIVYQAPKYHNQRLPMAKHHQQ